MMTKHLLCFASIPRHCRNLLAEARFLRTVWADFGVIELLSWTNGCGHQHVGEMKTEASQKPVPMDSVLATALHDWRKQTPYRHPEDWVFASPKMKGRQPYWPETPLKCFVRPAAKRLGIMKNIGWYTFRRTFATLLKGSAEDLKTVQELMHHANSRLMLDVYAQA